MNIYKMKVEQDFPAIQWLGTNLREVIDFMGLHPSARGYTWEEYENLVGVAGLMIFTSEGKEFCPIGNYIVKLTNDWMQLNSVDFHKHFELKQCEVKDG